MGHVDMFWVYFILHFAYIVSDEDCHVVYDLVRKLVACELEQGMEDVCAGFTRRGTGILLFWYLYILSRLHDELHLGVFPSTKYPRLPTPEQRA